MQLIASRSASLPGLRKGLGTLSQRTSLRQSRQPIKPTALLFKIFGKGDQDASMGSSGSKVGEWQPASADTPRRVSSSDHDVTPLTKEQRIAEAAKLTDFQRYVTLQRGTEQAYTGKTMDGSSHNNKQKGMYLSAMGGLPLFSSDTKFDSGTGWPSFWAPIDPNHVVEITDTSILFMQRVEVVDARSGAHLGHVFNDGPRPTGKRYCINAAALRFVPEGEPLPPESRPVKQQEQ